MLSADFSVMRNAFVEPHLYANALFAPEFEVDANECQRLGDLCLQQTIRTDAALSAALSGASEPRLFTAAQHTHTGNCGARAGTRLHF